MKNKIRIGIINFVLIFIFLSIFVLAFFQDLEVYYSFNLGERNSTDVFDLSGNDYNAFIVGGDFVDGIIGTGFHFDQPNEYVNATGIIVGEDYPSTFNFWFKTTNSTTPNNDLNIVRTDNNVNGDFTLLFQYPDWDEGGGLTIQMLHVGTSGDNIASGSPLQNNTWYMITLIYNGSQNGGDLYINSIHNDSNTYSSTGSTVNENPVTFIGQGDQANYINGTIDEFGFWNRTLTQQEINRLYNSGAGFNIFAENFTLTLVDTKSNEFILLSNSTVNGTFYSSNPLSGEIVTSILANSTSPVNITSDSSGFFTSNLLNVIPNSTFGSIFQINMTSTVPRHDVTAISNITSSAINNFTITDNLGFSKTTTNGTVRYTGVWNTSTNITITSAQFETKTHVFNNSVEDDFQFNLRPGNTFVISVYDEISKELITNDNVTVTVIQPDVFSSNLTSDSGSFNFSLLVPGEYRINYKDLGNDTYFERNYYITLTNGSYNEIDLYLLNKTYSNIFSSDGVLINVLDTVNNDLAGAIVNVNKYYAQTNTFETVERLKTNFEGDALSYLTSDGFYRFIIEFPEDNIVLNTDSTLILEEPLTFIVSLGDDPSVEFFQTEGISHNLVWVNSTSTFSYTYNDASLVASEHCLTVNRFSGTREIFIDQTCSSSQSGTLLVTITPQNFTYIAKATAVIGGESINIDTLTIVLGRVDAFGQGAFIMLFILTILIAFVGFWNIVVSLMLVPLPLVLFSAAGIITLALPVTLSVMLAMWIIAFIVARRA